MWNVIYIFYLFLWCKAEFSASLLLYSVSHNPSEIILVADLLHKKHFLFSSVLKTVVLLCRFFCLFMAHQQGQTVVSWATCSSVSSHLIVQLFARISCKLDWNLCRYADVLSQWDYSFRNMVFLHDAQNVFQMLW